MWPITIKKHFFYFSPRQCVKTYFEFELGGFGVTRKKPRSSNGIHIGVG